MKKELGVKSTLGEYERLTCNLDVYNKINQEQKDWLEEFMDKHDYNLKKVVLQLNEGVLWVIINTKNSVRQFSKE